MADTEHHVRFERRGGEWLVEGEPAKHHVLACGKHPGSHKIVMEIDQPDDRYAFRPSAIWVEPDDGKCPSHPASHDDISAVHAGPGKLVVDNRNLSNDRLRYQLNVYDTRDGSDCPIDPVIDNGGHG